MEALRENLDVIALGIAIIASWFNMKSDVRAQCSRLDSLENADKLQEDAMTANCHAIRELQMQHVATVENRQVVGKMLEKQDIRMEKMDHKMDELLKAITAVSTKLQERTKELHS